MVWCVKYDIGVEWSQPVYSQWGRGPPSLPVYRDESC